MRMGREDCMKVKSHEELFKRPKILHDMIINKVSNAKIKLLDAIVQNDMDISKDDITEFISQVDHSCKALDELKSDIDNIISLLKKYRKDVVTYIVECNK